MNRAYILAGGSGCLGSHLARALEARGDVAIVLTRDPARHQGPGRAVAWDGATVGPWAKELEGAAGLVNFTGKNIHCRFTPARRSELLRSRLDAVRALGEALEHCAHPPPTWVQMGSTAFYGDTGEKACDETAPPGAPGGGFLTDLAQQWEAAFAQALPPAMRGVVMRMGIVLDREQGAFPLLARAVRLFAGSAAGHGRQRLPWIHAEDWTRLALACLDDPRWSGLVNACAPQVRSNAQFMADLRAAFHRPWVPPAPAFAVHWAAFFLDTEAEAILLGRHAVPAKAQALGFQWRHPTLREAADDLLGARGSALANTR